MNKCRECKKDWLHAFKLASPETYLWLAARSRANKGGLPFSIWPTDVVIPAVCPVLGIPLDRRDREHTPSLDEKVQGLGYVPGNCFVISGRANRIKSDASIVEMEAVLAYMRKA